MPNNFDVVIIGAGPGGCSAAIELAQRGFQVAILEKSNFPRHRIGESLPPKIFSALRILGVEEEIKSLGFAPMTGTTVYQAGQVRTNNFDLSQASAGLQVERARFDQALLDQAIAKGCKLYSGRPVSKVEINEDSSTAWIEDDSFTARWLIDASGSRSIITRTLGLKKKSKFRTLALCGYWRSCRLPDNILPTNTLFEMLPSAWIWSVLRSDGLRNITIGIDPESLDAGTKKLTELYHGILEQSSLVGPLSHQAQFEGELMSYESTCFHSLTFLGTAYLLVGDAASFIDPLTSQGVYKAIQSGIMAAAVINTIHHRPDDAEIARQYYHDSQAAFVKNYAAITGSMYQASAYASEAFWADRMPSKTEAFLARSDQGRNFLEMVRGHGGNQITLCADRSRFSIERKGRASRGFIVSAPMLIGTDGQQLDLVDVRIDVLIPLLDGRTMSDIFEAYVGHTKENRSNVLAKRLRDGLSKMIDRDWLEYQLKSS